MISKEALEEIKQVSEMYPDGIHKRQEIETFTRWQDPTIEEKDKEIERLNNKNEELLTLYTTEREVKDYYKNIINELDTWLKEKVDSFKEDEYVSTNIEHERLAIKMVYYYLQELKGDKNNDNK